MNLSEAINVNDPSKLFVSLSSNPGKFGTTVHNAGYKALGLDYKYVACSATDIAEAITLIRSAGVRGASISMPFKEQVIQYLDFLCPEAAKIGAVNTVVNENGLLTGYNTDLCGFRRVIQIANVGLNDKINVLGSGGVASAVLEALKNHTDVTIWARNDKTRQILGEKYRRQYFHPYWMECNDGTYINCTPEGMKGEVLPLNFNRVGKLIDLIAMETISVQLCKKLGIPAFDGRIMAFQQAVEQFFIYTKHKAPIRAMTEALNEQKA